MSKIYLPLLMVSALLPCFAPGAVAASENPLDAVQNVIEKSVSRGLNKKEFGSCAGAVLEYLRPKDGWLDQVGRTFRSGYQVRVNQVPIYDSLKVVGWSFALPRDPDRPNDPFRYCMLKLDTKPICWSVPNPPPADMEGDIVTLRLKPSGQTFDFSFDAPPKTDMTHKEKWARFIHLRGIGLVPLVREIRATKTRQDAEEEAKLLTQEYRRKHPIISAFISQPKFPDELEKRLHAEAKDDQKVLESDSQELNQEQTDKVVASQIAFLMKNSNFSAGGNDETRALSQFKGACGTYARTNSETYAAYCQLIKQLGSDSCAIAAEAPASGKEGSGEPNTDAQ